jgi:hypothetical protein
MAGRQILGVAPAAYQHTPLSRREIQERNVIPRDIFPRSDHSEEQAPAVGQKLGPGVVTLVA